MRGALKPISQVTIRRLNKRTVKFIRTVERAHKRAAHSTLRFGVRQACGEARQ